MRRHLADVPTSVDAARFRVNVHGLVKQPLSLSVEDLKNDFEQVEVAAVCQCSGNSRGPFSPRVAGCEWSNGAKGNALWKGVRLPEILNKAGIAAGAVQVRLNGTDGPVLPATPDFIKALDVDVAPGEDVIIAYAMNGEPLLLLEGYPLRLVVSGWYATRWVEMLDDVEAIGKVDENLSQPMFWRGMATRRRSIALCCGTQVSGQCCKRCGCRRKSFRQTAWPARANTSSRCASAWAACRHLKGPCRR